MNRYFRCFQSKKTSPVKFNQQKAPILDLNAPLPESKPELESLQMQTARRMSIVNAQANKLLQDYQYTYQHQNLSKALHLKALNGQKLEEMKRLSFRLRQIQQKYDEVTSVLPLELPPPLHPIGRGLSTSREPSFKKDFSRTPSLIAHHS